MAKHEIFTIVQVFKRFFFLHSKCKNELGIFVLLFWKVFVGVARDYAEVIEAFFIISLVT